MAEAAAVHVNIFKNLEDNLKLVIQQIRDSECTKTSSANFNPDKYWQHLGAVFKALSFEGTKLSLAFTKPPLPDAKESEGLVTSMEKTVLELVSVFYSLPKTQGLTLRKLLQGAIVDVLDSVLSLFTSLAHADPGSGERKQATGVVWKETDIFTSLPKNNCQAVKVTLEQSAGLIGDALQEVEEIASNDGQCEDIFGDEDDDEELDNTEVWTAQEKEMVGPVKGLIKTSAKLLSKAREANKTKGKFESEEQVTQLDDLSDCAQRLSPAVDNLTSCLYAPIDHASVNSNATALSDVNGNLLSILRHCHLTDEGDAKWLDFLLKANTHNLTTLQHLLHK